jgi:hypothetical protein
MSNSQTRTKKEQEGYEVHLARQVEDALLYISTDSAISSKYRRACMMGGRCISETLAMRRAMGLPQRIQPRELAGIGEFSILLGGEKHQQKIELLKSRRLGFLETQKMRRFGAFTKNVINSCVVHRARIKIDGSYDESEFRYARQGNEWVGLNLPAKESKKTCYTLSTWRDFVHTEYGIESIYPALVEAAEWGLQHLWHVELTADKAGSVLFATDATGVKGFFTLRDKPDEMSRRPALMHWVREHFRKNRKSEEDEIFVRKHLRGREEFDWFGLKGTIYHAQESPR